MNILQVCNKPPYPPHDGGSLASYSLMRSFVRSGHSVTLLTMCTAKHQLSRDDRAELSKMVSLFTVDVDTSVNVFRLLVNLFFSRMPYNAERFVSPGFNAELSRLLIAKQFDMVQLEGLYLMPYAATIRQHSKARIVLRAHNVEHEIWDRIAANESGIFKKIYFRILSQRINRFETASIDQYDLLVPITERDLTTFRQMGNSRPAHVCPAALDVDDGLEIRLPEGLPTLFFLGSLEWRPNQEGLLWFTEHVLPAIVSLHSGITLHVAGRNAPAWLAKRLTAGNVFFHGEVPDAKAFISDHDIMVAPCFSGGGMRVKIIEAMSYGKPVITTPIGAEGLGVKHEEHILVCATANEFIEYLDCLVKFPDFYRKIGQSGSAFTHDNFDNMKVTAELIRFYTSNLT